MNSTDEEKIKDLGFTFHKEYSHDQFLTRRYRKGIIEVELSYEFGDLIAQEVTAYIDCQPATFAEIQALTHIAEGWEE